MKDIVLALSRGVCFRNRIDNSTIKNCDSAIEIYKERNCEFIAVVGGIFNNDNIQTKPIADLMTDYILRIEKNIKIISENKSLDTWENIIFLNNIFSEKSISKKNKIFICADKLHAIRVYILLKYYGFTPVIIKSKIKLDFKTIVKEIILIAMTLLDKTGEKNIFIKNILKKEREKRKNGDVFLSYNIK